MLFFVIPYKNKKDCLERLLDRLEEVVDVPYKVIVVEQLDDSPFNRGLLCNTGALFTSGYTYFHDVDVVPIQAKYKDYGHAVCLTSRVVDGLENPTIVWNQEHFGTVTGVPYEAFMAVGGFSEVMAGWGFEDDNLRNRLTKLGYRTERVDNLFFHFEHKSRNPLIGDKTLKNEWVRNGFMVNRDFRTGGHVTRSVTVTSLTRYLHVGVNVYG